MSFCLLVSPHPHMALPRTEICAVLKALYNLVQTLNINQYGSYFIFSFVPWAVSFNNAVMWPTGACGSHFQCNCPDVYRVYHFHLHRHTQERPLIMQFSTSSVHTVRYALNRFRTYVVILTLARTPLNDAGFIFIFFTK